LPEFGIPSRKPGIGKPWFDKFMSDVYPADEVISRGFSQRPPRAYDRWLEINAPVEYTKLKNSRRRGAPDPLSDQAWLESSPSRQSVKEEVALAKVAALKRKV